MMLKGIFGPKVKEVAEGWRKLHNLGLHNFHYSSLNIIRVDQTRDGEMCGATNTDEKKKKITQMYTKFWSGNLKGRDFYCRENVRDLI
jgi:hypothetical protein